jgi:hypothetical protein
MKQKTATCCFLLLLSLDLTSCRSQEKANSERENQIAFLTRYHARFSDQDLLLGCIVYAEESIRPLSIDSSSEFYKITTCFQDDFRSDANPDSLINDFLNKHGNIDFSSDKAMFRIKSYIECYRIVNDVIFGKIDSDDKSAEMKLLEDKIIGVKEIFKIYRLYVPEGNYLGSLSSSGVALYVHLAYYLYTLDIYKRNEILKSLL